MKARLFFAWRQGPKVHPPRRLSSRWWWSRTARACSVVPAIYAALALGAFSTAWLDVNSLRGQFLFMLSVGVMVLAPVLPYACYLWGPRHVKNLEPKTAPGFESPPPTSSPGPRGRPSGLADG